MDPEALARWGEAPARLRATGFRLKVRLYTVLGLAGFVALWVHLVVSASVLHLAPQVDALLLDFFLVALLVNGWFLYRHQRRNGRGGFAGGGGGTRTGAAFRSAGADGARAVPVPTAGGAAQFARCRRRTALTPTGAIEAPGGVPGFARQRVCPRAGALHAVDAAPGAQGGRLARAFGHGRPPLAACRRRNGGVVLAGQPRLTSIRPTRSRNSPLRGPGSRPRRSGTPCCRKARWCATISGSAANCASIVVSGSNMSGKSTMLRTLGVNAVLAQAGAPVRARRLRLSPLAVGASIRLTDSLQGGVSRFYAEILRLRQILDETAGSLPVLFLIDEFLHGTNSHDRRIGAEALVRGLVQRGAIGLITTHDLALADIADRAGRARRQRSLRGPDRGRQDLLRLPHASRSGAQEQRHRTDAPGGSGDLTADRIRELARALRASNWRAWRRPCPADDRTRYHEWVAAGCAGQDGLPHRPPRGGARRSAAAAGLGALGDLRRQALPDAVAAFHAVRRSRSAPGSRATPGARTTTT